MLKHAFFPESAFQFSVEALRTLTKIKTNPNYKPNYFSDFEYGKATGDYVIAHWNEQSPWMFRIQIFSGDLRGMHGLTVHKDGTATVAAGVHSYETAPGHNLYSDGREERILKLISINAIESAFQFSAEALQTFKKIQANPHYFGDYEEYCRLDTRTSRRDDYVITPWNKQSPYLFRVQIFSGAYPGMHVLTIHSDGSVTVDHSIHNYEKNRGYNSYRGIQDSDIKEDTILKLIGLNEINQLIEDPAQRAQSYSPKR